VVTPAIDRVPGRIMNERRNDLGTAPTVGVEQHGGET
jgi:hypothetical protein